MAEASEETKFCTNCKKDIAATNYLMHTMHCQRNIILCKKCNEPVPRNEIEAHNEEMHGRVVCEKCSKAMERWKLEEHKSLCTKRVVLCSYCELECSLDEMEEHESYCGSRTEVCPTCRQYVMIKNMKEHESRDCARTPPCHFVKDNNIFADNFGVIFPCEFCGDFFPDVTLIEHQSICRSVQLSEFNSLPEGVESYPAEDIPCEFCGDLFPLELLILHQSGCRPDLVHQAQSDGNQSPVEKKSNTSFLENISVNKEKSLIPCEFCHNKFMPAALIDHQSLCGITNTYNSDILEEGDQNLPEDIPCEFCGEPFPIEFLIGHQAVCNDNNLEQILSDELYPPDESEISHISSNEAPRSSRKRQESPKLEEVLSVRRDNVVKSADANSERNLNTLHNPVDKLEPKKDSSKSEYFKIDKKWLEKPPEANKPREFINVDSYFERWDKKQCFSKDTRYSNENRTAHERTYYYRSTTQREYDTQGPRRSYDSERFSVVGSRTRNTYREKENWSGDQNTRTGARNTDSCDYERPTKTKNTSTFDPLFDSVSSSRQRAEERPFEERSTRRPHQLRSLSPDDGNSKQTNVRKDR